MASLRISILVVPLFFVAPAFAEDAAPSALTTATMNLWSPTRDGSLSDKGGVSVWFRLFPGVVGSMKSGRSGLRCCGGRAVCSPGDIDAYAEIMPPTSLSKRLSDGTSARSYYIEIDPPVVSVAITAWMWCFHGPASISLSASGGCGRRALAAARPFDGADGRQQWTVAFVVAGATEKPG